MFSILHSCIKSFLSMYHFPDHQQAWGFFPRVSLASAIAALQSLPHAESTFYKSDRSWQHSPPYSSSLALLGATPSTVLVPLTQATLAVSSLCLRSIPVPPPLLNPTSARYPFHFIQASVSLPHRDTFPAH